MNKQSVLSGINELQKRGYSAVDAGDHIIVSDPRHQCGTDLNAGRLIVTGFLDIALHNGNAVSKFLYDRT